MSSQNCWWPPLWGKRSGVCTWAMPWRSLEATGYCTVWSDQRLRVEGAQQNYHLKWNKSSLLMLNCSFSEVFNLAKFGWLLMSMIKTENTRLPVLLAKLEVIWKGTLLKVLAILICRRTSLFEISCYCCKVPRTSAWSRHIAQTIPVPAVSKIMWDWKWGVSGNLVIDHNMILL